MAEKTPGVLTAEYLKAQGNTPEARRAVRRGYHASKLPGFEWSERLDRSWDLGAPSGCNAATVWPSGTWHTWDETGTGGENGVEELEPLDARIARAKHEAEDALLRQGWHDLDAPSTPTRGEPMDIRTLQQQAHDNARAKGWWDDQTGADGELDPGAAEDRVPEALALIHSEISEALEEFRRDAGLDTYVKDGKPEGFGVELADAVIRIFDLCGALDIDLAAAIEQKMAYNATRPHRHGGKRA